MSIIFDVANVHSKFHHIFVVWKRHKASR